jgi:hypothetical protein
MAIRIDCDKPPLLPWEGAVVAEHRKMGWIEWDSTKVRLFLSKDQKNGGVEGNELLKVIANKAVFNASLLDYLLEHPVHIPGDWKKRDSEDRIRFIYFWGTIYKDDGHVDGDLFVRCLYWSGKEWRSEVDWLGLDWDSSQPAAYIAA